MTVKLPISTILIATVLAALIQANNDCCIKKTVGSKSYTLIESTDILTPTKCKNGCVYQEEITKETFCFAPGDQAATCDLEEVKCKDPEGGKAKYPVNSTYIKACNEYVCANTGSWKEVTSSIICPNIPCPSLKTSCVANDGGNVIEVYQDMKFLNYEKCGELCEQHKWCKYWSVFTTGTSIPTCSLLKSCVSSENRFTISGNNLCPLPEPFPCPATAGFSCIESNNTNVVDTKFVDNYKVCGVRCRENNYCNFWTFSDLPLLPTINGTCNLLSSCAPHQVATGFPLQVTKSGNRNCPPQPQGRSSSSCCSAGFTCVGLCFLGNCGGLCLPLLQSSAVSSSLLQAKQSSFCRPPCYMLMDRCVCHPVGPPLCCPGCTGYCSGFGCVGHCPYENSIQESCSSLALQAHGDSCKSECVDTSNDGCQNCLETSLHDNCQIPSGSSCWKCAKTVWDAVQKCDFEPTILKKFECITNTLLNTGCSKCVCTLLCYFFPHSTLCSICEGFPNYTVNFESCPEGGVLADGYCFKAYAETETGGNSFDDSLAKCIASSDGTLAKVDNIKKVYAVTEAIQNSQVTECWIGGRREQQGGNFLWRDRSVVKGDNWAVGLPTDDYPSCMTQSATDSEWRNWECDQPRCYVCQYAPKN